MLCGRAGSPRLGWFGIAVLVCSCSTVLGLEDREYQPPAAAGSGGSRSDAGSAASEAGGGEATSEGGGGPNTSAGSSSVMPEAGAGGVGESAICGNGQVEAGEDCDDGNPQKGDGCTECLLDDGWSCKGKPSTCTATCGDGLVLGAEAQAGGCDDGNKMGADGCSVLCKVEDEYVCTGTPSKCAKTCGNGKLDPGETCEDNNSDWGDGCAACLVESGFTCKSATLPSVCTDVDECMTPETNDCDVNADCTNTKGSHTCTCKPGYGGDGRECVGPHCTGLGAICNYSLGKTNCCNAIALPGGSFSMGGGSTNATVASFTLDTYEVTVGRFRAFVAAYAGHPANGAATHPLIQGSGWQSPAWDDLIATSKDKLTTAIETGCGGNGTWDATGKNDALPMNCVSWFEAFAFCAWDGGRLPTEAEWEYAAAGGNAQRLYPWGNTPVPSGKLDSTADYANYYCLGDNVAPPSCTFADILSVGSKPKGIARFGNLDLAGSIAEWVLDWAAALPATCSNCAKLGKPTDARIIRGGHYYSDELDLRVTTRPAGDGYSRNDGTGFRCARDM